MYLVNNKRLKNIGHGEEIVQLLLNYSLLLLLPYCYHYY